MKNKYLLFPLILAVLLLARQVSADSLTLSQTSVFLNIGQSISVSINTTSGRTANVVSNSNSSVVSAVVSGDNLSLFGTSSGYSQVRVCTYYAYECATVDVTVGNNNNNNYNYGNISFSSNSVFLNVGQTYTVSIYNNNSYYSGNSFYVSNNSNSSVAGATISGNTLSIYGNSSGTTSITVCGNNNYYTNSFNNNCGTVMATVSGNYYNGNITFSNSSVNVNVGQTITVTVYNSNNLNNYYINGPAFYVSNNSNSSVAGATISGNTLSIYGNMAGTTTVTVCANNYSGSCGSMTATVSGGAYTGGVTFSSSSVSIGVGQTTSVTVSTTNGYYNNNSFFVTDNSNPQAITVTISSGTLSIYGNSVGNGSVTVCNNYNTSQCGTVYVTVNNGNNYNNNIWFSQSNVSLNSGQTSTITIYSNNYYSNSYYISSNSNNYVVSASISGNNLYLNANSTGSTNISVCNNYSTLSCATVYVTVNGGNYYGNQLYFNSTSLPQPIVNQYYTAQMNVSGGSAPYNYYVVSGSLPPGLYLSNNGTISGTTNSTALYNFQVQATDSSNRSASQNFMLQATGSGSVLGTSIFKNGTMIKENGTIYIVYKNLKSGFANMDAFTGLGFRLQNVMDVANSGLVDSGYVIGTSHTAHPWGSWIKSDSTVYFVHQDGLIPISSYDVFLNNGGDDRLVVKASQYDFIGKPILSLMTYNDYRLR